MIFQRLAILLSVGFLAGCAQTVWVKPGASPQEHAVANLQCDVFAANSTTRQPVYGNKPGAVIASAIVAGIAEGLEQANWKTRCMQANGFLQVPVQPAGSVAVATGPISNGESQQQASAPAVTIAAYGRPIASEPTSAPVTRVAADRPKCTAYSYQDYLRQQKICDADVGNN